ncbi:uncharacterized protein HD556DRAFT_1431302 [Suillus plorans]|uniref:Uncharacterized protein n=1 Tax=Suillus plorans TaxID=116603 RepID=A0A9P7AWJ7_9AGAM|nr:uncharacterized protein HD556DRAFT_1431302 [Suillus plorans]KAG1796724.1 hypothetical protein HD556DRAFT_1431302 [Suillus plorans]
MVGCKQLPTSIPGVRAQRLVINASYVAATYTYLALTTFGLALLLGCTLHYKKFHILIALTSGPHFALVSLQYFLRCLPNTSFPGFLFVVGIVRTLMCSGWVYIMSNDDHDMHDVLMVTYILCNMPWMWGGVLCTPIGHVKVSYLFWSIFTSLITTLFYFSVWQLALSGLELSLLVLLSSALLGIRPLCTWALTCSGQVMLRVVVILTGSGSYALKSPMQRLIVVNFANMVLLVGQTTNWVCDIVLGLELVLLSLAKHVNHSTNPIWPMLNEEPFLAFCVLYELATRPSTIPEEEKQISGSKDSSTVASHGWLASSIALGSMIFILHCFFIDPRYKDSQPEGPLPHLHGSLTLIAQAIGLALPTILPACWLINPLWFSYGCTSAFVMYRFRDWMGFVGGLNLAVFVMLLLPTIIRQSAQPNKSGRTYTYFTAFFVMILFYLADVWTVTYTSMPGGVYLRSLLHNLSQHHWCLNGHQEKRTAANSIVHILSSTSFLVRHLLTLFLLSAVLVTIYRWTPVGPRPYKLGTGIINAGIWTVHFGIDNIGHDSQRDMKLDVVGLLETDLHRTVYGNCDLMRVALQDLGYYVDLGPGPNIHTWGAALLLKFPIIHLQHHLLPSPHGELVPAIKAVLDVYGSEVAVVVSHNGQEQDPLDCKLQSKELACIMAKSYPHLIIFLGYVVTKPHISRSPYEILVYDGIVHDIDPQDGDHWCEYILYRELYRTVYAQLQIGQFWFPMEYYGNNNEGGMNGHFYHVFDTVRLQPITGTDMTY